MHASESVPSVDFDRVIDRRGADSEKWNRYSGRDVLPLWVADMDFAAPPEVLDAMRARLDHGVFGYATAPRQTTEAVLEMLEREYAWRAQAEWLVWTPGLAVALNLVCRQLEPSATVLTSTPVYPPFLNAPRFTEHALRTVPLEELRLAGRSPSNTQSDGGRASREPGVAPYRYEFDFDRFEQALAPPTGAYLFCHPQNPTGRAWTRAELERVAELCLRHGVLVCSDEVHNGLVLDETPHVPLATLSPELAARTITLMSPSKTYNLAGLMTAFAIIPDADLRRRFQHAARGIVTELNAFGYAACEAAFRRGAPWRKALLAYLRGNRDLVESAVATMPGLRMNHVEATYLAWIDCRATGRELPVADFEAAGVGLSDGAFFGAPGWVRLNFGCPRSTLREALARMSRARASGNHDLGRGP